jgi:hypothetical protein
LRCLKTTARSHDLRTKQGNATEKLKKKDAVAILLKAWEHLSSAAMEPAWRIYEEGEGQEEDGSEHATDEREEGDRQEEGEGKKNKVPMMSSLTSPAIEENETIKETPSRTRLESRNKHNGNKTRKSRIRNTIALSPHVIDPGQT